MRKQPLLTLLLLATASADIALTYQSGVRDFTTLAMLLGLLLGQTGALALWTVWGRGLRLARLSTLVVGTCLLAFVAGPHTSLGRNQWLAILCIYTLIVYLGSLTIAAAGAYASRSSPENGRGPAWQVSLIELFGWMILVAIASFAARSMEFHFLRNNTYIALKVGAMVAVPLTLAGGIRNGLTDFTRSKYYWFFFAAILTTTIVALPRLEPRMGLGLILAQAGYLLTWVLVLQLDRAMTRHQSTDGTEEDPQLDGESGQLNS